MPDRLVIEGNTLTTPAELTTPMPERLPECYLPASWRNTLPVDDGRVGLGFELDDGSVVRLHVGVEDAEHIIGSLTESLKPSPH